MKRLRVLKIVLLGLMWLGGAPTDAGSLRFFGNGSNDIDRVKIPLSSHDTPVNVGEDFTIEFWMQTVPGNDGTVTAASHGNGWITGNVIVDRDVFGDGDWGDFGISIGRYGSPSSARKVAFGCDRAGSGLTIVGSRNVADGQWHHIAVTRQAASGLMQIFVDGQLDASGWGPTGDLSYRIGRPTAWPVSDPFLVLGAEKHDAGTAYPSFRGYLDELRISRIVRYTANFTRPSAPFTTDEFTVGLYHFDEGAGSLAQDSSGAAGGPSHGTLHIGGHPVGPAWSTNTPFSRNHALFGLRRQAIPIVLRADVMVPSVVLRQTTTNWLTASENQLVLVMDSSQSRFAIEEWNATLTAAVDRNPAMVGTQSVLLASKRVAMLTDPRRNTITVAIDFETGGTADIDWDNDGVADHVGSVSFVGTLTVNPSRVISDPPGEYTATGAVTRVIGQWHGVLNDPMSATSGAPRILWRGEIRSARSDAFLVPDEE